jgi:hypothetical protein
VTAANTNRATASASAGVTGSLLAIHLLAGAGDLPARLGLHRALALIRLVHDDDIVQQLPIDVRGKHGWIDVVRPDLLASAIKDF